MSILFKSKFKYPTTVYEDIWEDLELLCENWITLHGVDRTFCKLALKNFAEQLKADYLDEETKQ